MMPVVVNTTGGPPRRRACRAAHALTEWKACATSNEPRSRSQLWIGTVARKSSYARRASSRSGGRHERTTRTPSSSVRVRAPRCVVRTVTSCPSDAEPALRGRSGSARRRGGPRASRSGGAVRSRMSDHGRPVAKRGARRGRDAGEIDEHAAREVDARHGRGRAASARNRSGGSGRTALPRPAPPGRPGATPARLRPPSGRVGGRLARTGRPPARAAARRARR